MAKQKKKFKETKVGAFLTEKAPKLVSQLGEFLPDQGGLGIVKNLITSDKSIKAADKEMALKLLEQDIAEMNNISSRWASDMKSDSWLSKNVRPMVLIFLVISTVLMIFIDAGTIKFTVEEKWTDLLQLVLITVIGAYFGGRSYEKGTKVKNK